MLRHLFGAGLMACVSAAALPAAAQSVFDTLREAEPVSGKPVYVIPHGGREILALDPNGPSLPDLQLSGFSSFNLNWVGAQHSSIKPRVELSEINNCGPAGPCFEIHSVAESETGRAGDWILRVFRPADGEPLRGGAEALEPGTPIWTRGPAQGQGVNIDRVHPRLVLAPHPTRTDAWTIRELGWIENDSIYALDPSVLVNSDDPDATPRPIFNADKAAQNSYREDFYLLDIDNAGGMAVWTLKVYSACRVYTGTQCYWMENTSGNWCYVPSTIFKAETPKRCFELNSCGEGGGQSGGGCYKWSDSSDGARIPYTEN
ncbi:MAG: hypothetical protein TEF_00990 [Rhizobiales bacterium NRL2]|jgi:hypothetical protein|nr:MAG: hypothetical protein TEF_00990 [Rhizobiales bacterium NRL2]